MARMAMHELQTTCFADASKRRLLTDGHACADQRRRFTDSICGADALVADGDGPRAFALAARRGSRGALEPFLFRSYEATPTAAFAGTQHAKLHEAIAATSAAPFMSAARRSNQRGAQCASSAGALRATRPLIPLRSIPSSDRFPRAKVSCAEDGAPEEASAGRVHSLADGGMLANDPTLVALEEARALWPIRYIRYMPLHRYTPLHTVTCATGEGPLADSPDRLARVLRHRRRGARRAFRL